LNQGTVGSGNIDLRSHFYVWCNRKAKDCREIEVALGKQTAKFISTRKNERYSETKYIQPLTPAADI
jgi:hypothetical protein